MKEKVITNVWIIKRYGSNTLSVTCNSGLTHKLKGAKIIEPSSIGGENG